MITVERLKTIPMFAELDEEQLAHLAPMFHYAHHTIGEIITKQGDPGEALYVLDQGTLRVRYVDSKDHERVLGYLNAPAFFGETSLFTGLMHDVTIDVFSPEADLLVLPKHEFDALVTEFPQLGKDIVVRDDVQKKLAQRIYPWLSAGEIVLVKTRRHWYALVARLIIPSVIAVILLLLALATHQLDPTSANPPGSENLFTTLSIALLLLTILWAIGAGAWLVVDWSNDYYIVTNKRVIHIEKVIFFFDEREEALMEQITNVIEAGEGWAQRVLGFTELRVETQGRQIEVTFDFVPRSKRIPQIIFEQINRLRDRVALEKRERVRAGIREDLWNRLAPDTGTGNSMTDGTPESKPMPPSAALAAAPMPSQPVRRMRFTAVGDRLNQWFGLKVESPTQITWRKHWIVLVEREDEPLAALAILVSVAIIHITGIVPLRIFDAATNMVSLLAISAAWFVLLFVVLFWLWYQYVDWSNDIYRVTDDRLIDTERSPFGLSMRSIETTLDRVQDVSYVSQGVIANLFNYGDLIIETAGAGRFTFHGIRDPRGAIQEIFRRRDAHRANMAREQAKLERRQFLDWFMEYHRFLVEQGVAKQAQPKTKPSDEGMQGDRETRRQVDT